MRRLQLGSVAQLRARLLDAVAHIERPVFLIHAANDYSVASGTVLDARRAQLHKPHRLEIYPPIGRTADDGHAFPLIGVRIWEPDVFAFLDANMRKSAHRGGAAVSVAKVARALWDR